MGERLQEAVALLSAAATGRARAPRSHSGRRVVDIVGRYCASCPEEKKNLMKYSYIFVILLLSKMLMERSYSRNRVAALQD